MEIFLFFPLVIQSFVMFFDEFYFHVKRGLPLWERIGHPLDTFSVVLCLSYVLLVPYSSDALFPFLALSILSCLLVTKDEFVHHEHCEAKEQWLHALLFLNHPLVLITIGYMWSKKVIYTPILFGQLMLISLFCLYQIVYWNFIWKKRNKLVKRNHDQ